MRSIFVMSCESGTFVAAACTKTQHRVTPCSLHADDARPHAPTAQGTCPRAGRSGWRTAWADSATATHNTSANMHAGATTNVGGARGTRTPLARRARQRRWHAMRGNRGGGTAVLKHGAGRRAAGRAPTASISHTQPAAPGPRRCVLQDGRRGEAGSVTISSNASRSFDCGYTGLMLSRKLKSFPAIPAGSLTDQSH